jgi:hypothetical protein
MSYIAFPLRLRGQLLARCDFAEALVALLGIMARTPRGSWRGLPAFGLRELLAESPKRRELLRQAVLEANAALAELGVEGIAVESIELDSVEGGESSYTVALASEQGANRAHSLKLNVSA